MTTTSHVDPEKGGDRTPPQAVAQCAFVVGSPRSGTSVMAWALAQHPDIETGPESDFPYYLLRPEAGIGAAYDDSAKRSDGWIAKHRVTRDEFLAAVGIGLDHLFRTRVDARIWVDSTPACALVCPDLAKMFPLGRFVHMIRDGRAAVASMINSGFDTRVARDFEFACETWATLTRRVHRFALENPDRCVEIRQEDLRRDPRPQVERALRLLGVPFDAACVEFLGKGLLNSSWGNRSGEDVRRQKPVDVAPVRPWEQWSPAWWKVFRAKAGDTMRELGYELD